MKHGMMFFSLPLLFLSLAVHDRSSSQSIRWQQSNSPRTGTCIASAVSDNGFLFVGTQYGVFRSMDDGQDWDQVPSGVSRTKILSLLFAGDSTLYAGGTSGSISRSSDDGESWATVKSGLGGLFNGIRGFAVNVKSGNLFLASDSGVYRSTDGGYDWTPALLAQPGSPFSSIASNDSGDLFTVTSDGKLLRSADDGGAWRLLNPGWPATMISALIVDAHGNPVVDVMGSGIQRSTDGGSSWSAVGSLLSGYAVTSLAADSAGAIFCGLENAGLFLYPPIDTGWALLTTNVPLTVSIRRGGFMLMGTDHGIETSPGISSQWTLSYSGLDATAVFSVAIGPDGAIYAGGSQGGIFRSTDEGVRWRQMNKGLTNLPIQEIAADRVGHLYAAVSSDGVYLSSDGGESWASVLRDSALSTNKTFALQADGTIFFGNHNGIYRSPDQGGIWAWVSHTNTYALTVDHHGDLIAGVDGGKVLRSTDSGDTWSSADVDSQGYYVSALVSSGSDLLFAGTFSGIFRSTDGGLSWTMVDSGLPSDCIASLALDSAGAVYTGTCGSAVYRSMDEGGSWANAGTGMTNHSVWALGAHPDGFLLAGTGDGVFKSSGLASTYDELRGALPGSYSLHPAYPNPFNPTTTISYSLPVKSRVSVTIVNLLGQFISILRDGDEAAGIKTVTWNASDAASGIYFCRFQASDLSNPSRTFTVVEKLLFLK